VLGWTAPGPCYPILFVETGYPSTPKNKSFYGFNRAGSFNHHFLPKKKVVVEKLNKKIRTKTLENGGVSICPNTAI
jgi:hypothetical protein